jgi:hypothetical protein
MRGRLAQGEPDKAQSDIRSHRLPFLRTGPDMKSESAHVCCIS